MGHKQIKPAIPIEIDKRTSRTPSRRRSCDLSLSSYLSKRSISVVMEQQILSPVRDEEIIEAIVIKVSDTHTLAPSASRQAGLFGDVRKGSIPIVVKQLVAWRRAWSKSLYPRAVHKEQVQPAISVVVEERDPGAGRLQDVLLPFFSAGDMVELHSCSRPHLAHDEAKGPWRRNSLLLKHEVQRTRLGLKKRCQQTTARGLQQQSPAQGRSRSCRSLRRTRPPRHRRDSAAGFFIASPSLVSAWEDEPLSRAFNLSRN